MGEAHFRGTGGILQLQSKQSHKEREQVMLCDCHTHLDQYETEELDGLIKRAKNTGVGLIITAGTTIDSSGAGIEIAGAYESVFAGVGIHPMDIKGPFTDETYEKLRQMALECEKVVVISEIGMDFLKSAPERRVQEHAFREQIRLARELALPIVFHSREAHAETLRILKEEHAYEVGAVMHYFQGDERTARECMDMGFYISLARPLTRLPLLQEVVKKLPLESMVLETDAFPQPWKKREDWTEPAHVKLVAEKLAELKGVSLEEVAHITTSNLKCILKQRLPL
ncbi:MAG: TatD family hydrolase [Chloroflexi bacterium]|nr:TatD family hydrolase [Chloroflexota bacterium]